MKTNFRGKIRKGGEGGTPQIRNSFFAGKKSVKGGGRGGTPLTDKIRKVVFEVFPKGHLQFLMEEFAKFKSEEGGGVVISDPKIKKSMIFF